MYINIFKIMNGKLDGLTIKLLEIYIQTEHNKTDNLSFTLI